MNTRQHTIVKTRGSRDITYLGKTIDEMIWQFMEQEDIDGLTLAIVQAPYIPRVIGYGMSDQKQKRLASVHTMYPIGPISQAYLAVAIMQLYERGKLDVYASITEYLKDVPKEWKDVRILDALRHASGIQDFREHKDWSQEKRYCFDEVLSMVNRELKFVPGSSVSLSATNAMVLSEIVERASGMSYQAFVKDNQIAYLELKHTGFTEDMSNFPHEDVSSTENIHQLFKKDPYYIDPVEPASSYDDNGKKVSFEAIRGFNDIWSSAQDVSFWDISLAGSVLIHEAEHRQLIYAPWKLIDGKEVPAVAGWQFYQHRGLMDIKGSVPGFSSFLSRFTDASELVCVTLLANKEGIDFTNLGRKIAGAFGDLLSTNYDDHHLYLIEGTLSVEDTIEKLEKELKKRQIPLFAKFDHQKNAQEVGLDLRPTTVLVFGSPIVGTKLMQADQSISVELPLKISIWEDEAGSTWLAFPKIKKMTENYNLEQHPVALKIDKLMKELVHICASVYD